MFIIYIYIYIHILRYSCIIHINLDLYLSNYIYIYVQSHAFFFRNPSLPSLFVSQNPRFLSSSKVQVLHELPSAEDFFKTYVLTGTPVEPWLHITLVMTRNTQLINTNIGNLVMLYFVGIYGKTLIKVDHGCEAQSFILT